VTTRAGGAAGAAWARAAAGWSAPARHRLFTAAFCLGAALRVVTMLGYPPAIWFGGDSASYLSTALRLLPSTSRVSGYGLMLALLRPFHSFAVVTAVQHAMGLAVAVMTYLLLRRYRLPAWGATLAALPVLLSAYQIQLEHEILPSAAFGFLVMAAVTLTLWWRGARPTWAAALAGLCLAVSATFWPVGLPLLIVFLLYLVLRRQQWQVLAATVAISALPLVSYLAWFDHTRGHVAFSSSDGVYLWSRTMTFANCAVIRPPADERGLCPDQPLGRRPAASVFLWDPGSPLSKLPGNRFAPAKNALALHFAFRAIAAQPLAYLAAVAHDTALAFAWNIPPHPLAVMTWRYEFAAATSRWISPRRQLAKRHTVASDQRAYGGVTGTRAVRPFAGFLRGYQRFAYLRGTFLGVLLLTGLAGIVRCWRHGGMRHSAGWGGPGLYPWVTSVALLVVPVATADYSLRYVLISAPAICLAAGFAFARPDPGGTREQGRREREKRRARPPARSRPRGRKPGPPPHRPAVSRPSCTGRATG
jgi:hypothetical protein